MTWVSGLCQEDTQGLAPVHAGLGNQLPEPSSRGCMSESCPSSPVTAAQVPNPTLMRKTTQYTALPIRCEELAKACIPGHSTQPLLGQISWDHPHRTQLSRPVHTDVTPRATTTPVTCHAPERRNKARRSSGQENPTWRMEQGEGFMRRLLCDSRLDGSIQAADSPRLKSRWGRAGIR